MDACDCVGRGYVGYYRYVGLQYKMSSFSSNSDWGMELNLHHSFHSFLHTLTGKSVLSGPRPCPHPYHLCETVLHPRGTTGAEDQV